MPDPEKLLERSDVVQLKRCIYAAQRPGLPPVCTHNVNNDATDPILNHIRRIGLFNSSHDRVKVCKKTHQAYCRDVIGCLKGGYTFGKCQRPVFSLSVSQITHVKI
jgi:hypothetical protein